ncbi:hypothetical protein D3C87_1932410 [compost metagenome]
MVWPILVPDRIFRRLTKFIKFSLSSFFVVVSGFSAVVFAIGVSAVTMDLVTVKTVFLVMGELVSLSFATTILEEMGSSDF